MSKNIRTQIGKVIGKTLNSYHARVKPVIDDIKFKEQYQGRIIDCMVGEVDDNYLETPVTDAPIVKLEHSKEGLVKVPSIKGKTILVDADGNETDTPAEGCKLVSVGEDEDNKLIILSKNKNLFDGRLYSGWVRDGVVDFRDLGTHDNMLTDYIKVEKNQDYVNNCDFNYLWTFDENKKFIKLITGNGSKNVEDATYAIFGKSISIANMNSVDKTKIQIETGRTITSHVPHKSHKTEILLDEPLRSLPNGVCDEIIGNQLIRRIGLKVLNSKNCNWSPWTVRETEGLFYFHAGYYIENAKTLKEDNCKSNRFVFTNSFGNANNKNEHMGTYKTNPHMAIYSDKANSLSEVRDYFDNNVVQVMYELEEPVIIEMPNTLTLQGFDDTTMYIENSITPTISYGYNALIPYKEELKTQKEEVETNTLDIENNIIPYLMDMEYNLMFMEDN